MNEGEMKAIRENMNVGLERMRLSRRDREVRQQERERTEVFKNRILAQIRNEKTKSILYNCKRHILIDKAMDIIEDCYEELKKEVEKKC